MLSLGHCGSCQKVDAISYWERELKRVDGFVDSLQEEAQLVELGLVRPVRLRAVRLS